MELKYQIFVLIVIVMNMSVSEKMWPKNKKPGQLSLYEDSDKSGMKGLCHVCNTSNVTLHIDAGIPKCIQCKK